MSDKDDLIYDEDDSVAFIQNYLPQELKGTTKALMPLPSARRR